MSTTDHTPCAHLLHAGATAIVGRLHATYVHPMVSDNTPHRSLSLAEHVDALRATLGVPVADLADAVGVSRVHMWRVLRATGATPANTAILGRALTALAHMNGAAHDDIGRTEEEA